jgi:hypothetical protein
MTGQVSYTKGMLFTKYVSHTGLLATDIGLFPASENLPQLQKPYDFYPKPV